jgi:hypothetical protein
MSDLKELIDRALQDAPELPEDLGRRLGLLLFGVSR